MFPYIAVFTYTILAAFILQKARPTLLGPNDSRTRSSSNISSIKRSRKNTILLHKRNVQFIGFAIIALAPMILLHAFRYGFGTDYNGTYRSIFYYAQSASGINILRKQHVEWGYILLNVIIGKFTKDYVWACTWTSIITFVILSIAIIKYVDHIALAFPAIILSGFYFMSMQTCRQMLAAAIFALGLPYIRKRKFLKYLICVLIAAQFHISVLILIPFYFLYGIKYKKSLLLIIIGACIALRGPIYYIVLKLMSIIPKYAIYFQYMTKAVARQPVWTFLFAVLFVVVYCMAPDGDDDRFWIIFITFGLISSLLSSYIAYFERLIEYAYLPVIFYIPDFLAKMKRIKNKCFCYAVTLTALIIVQVYTVFIANWYRAVPYVSIFER